MISVQDLSRLRIFKETSAASLEHLAKNMADKSYKKGDVILKEGETNATLYLIASGSVSVQKAMEGGRAKQVARLEKEEFFGEMAFLENQPASATVIADEEARLFLMPRTALNEEMGRDPKMALNQVLTLVSGLSARLRRTTRELVSVFETGRVVGQSAQIKELSSGVLSQLRADMGPQVSIGFYRWNPFNDEYNLIESQGPAGPMFPAALEANTALIQGLGVSQTESFSDFSKPSRSLAPLETKSGHLIISRVDRGEVREGLLIYYEPQSGAFDAGERQMIETISAVLAPAMESARGREEEMARQRLEQGKRYSI